MVFTKKYNLLKASNVAYNAWAIQDENNNYIGNVNRMYGEVKQSKTNLSLDMDKLENIDNYLEDIAEIIKDFRKWRETR